MQEADCKMPDLMLVEMEMCSSIDGPMVTCYGKYTQTGMFSERHYPRCDCPAYKYSKATINFGGYMVKPECKHILAVQKETCGWHQQYSPESQEEKGKCPRCGASTVLVYVGV
jgi:hypothetical protein